MKFLIGLIAFVPIFLSLEFLLFLAVDGSNEDWVSLPFLAIGVLSVWLAWVVAEGSKKL